jgi:hypothetical protein
MSYPRLWSFRARGKTLNRNSEKVIRERFTMTLIVAFRNMGTARGTERLAEGSWDHMATGQGRPRSQSLGL